MSTQKTTSVVKRKALLAVAVSIFAIFVVFTAKWVVGNSISLRAEFKEISEFAVVLAPDDPQTRFAHAVLLSRTFEATDNAASLKQLERATALSPHNYLLWLELGKSLEQNGEAARAVAAFRQAKALAPNYSSTKWMLGNALLRQDETDEAVTLLIAAAESEPVYADNAAALLWQIFDGELAAIKSTLKDAPVTTARLVPILGREKKLDEALEIWNSLGADEKLGAFSAPGKTLYGQLIEAKRFRDALNVLSAVSSGPLGKHATGSVFDGGFESRIPNDNKSVFEWRFAPDPRMGLTEGQKRSGSYSFLIGSPPGTASIKSIAQTIAVEPAKNYEFEIYFRSDLKTNGAVKWEIINAADGKRLSATDALTASGEWAALRASFNVPIDTDGIEIRLIKECASGECSIEGNIWFDDASLKQTD